MLYGNNKIYVLKKICHNIDIYRMAQLPDHIIDRILLFVRHTVDYIINESVEWADELDFEIIVKDDSKIWFIDYDLEWRGQEFEDK